MDFIVCEISSVANSMVSFSPAKIVQRKVTERCNAYTQELNNQKGKQY